MRASFSHARVITTSALGNSGEGFCRHCATPVLFILGANNIDGLNSPYIHLFLPSAGQQAYKNIGLYTSIKKDVSNPFFELHSLSETLIEKPGCDQARP